MRLPPRAPARLEDGPGPRPEHGEGFVLVCPACFTPTRTRAGGRCGSCGRPAVDASLPELLDLAPPGLRDAAGFLVTWTARLAEWPLASPWSAAFALGELLAGPAGLEGWLLVPVAALVGALVDLGLGTRQSPSLPPGSWLERERVAADPSLALPGGATPRPRLTGYRSRSLHLDRSWWDLTRIRARRGLAVHLAVTATGAQGRVLELALRLRGPDDRWLAGLLPGYRGTAGEALARHRTPPLRHDDSAFHDLWIFLPLRALGLPAGLARAELVAEVTLAPVGGEGLLHRMPIDFVPSPEDLLPPVQAQLEPGAIALAPGLLPGPPACAVCGEAEGAPAKRCPTCEAVHHAECWAYLGGCSRYGCPEGPARDADPAGA